MSGVTTGGVTVKVLTGRSAAPLQRYRDMLGEGQEPHLFSATRHCSYDAQIGSLGEGSRGKVIVEMRLQPLTSHDPPIGGMDETVAVRVGVLGG